MGVLYAGGNIGKEIDAVMDTDYSRRMLSMNCPPDSIFDYKRATMEDIEELVRTRIIVLRAANKLSAYANLS